MSLTERRLKILELKAEGKPNWQIAKTLHISRSTVDVELIKINEHFGVSSPPAAIGKAQRQGIIPLPEANSVGAITAGELQVGRLVMEGKSNKEISGQLDITEGTVSNRVSSMLRKLNCSSRAQLAAVLAARGIK